MILDDHSKYDSNMQSKPYQSEEEYLSDSYAFLDSCLLHLYQKIQNGQFEKGMAALNGWFLDGIVNELLYIREQAGLMESQLDGGNNYQLDSLAKIKNYIDQRIEATEKQGIYFSVRKIYKLFQLTEFEFFLFQLSMASSYNSKYELIFSELSREQNRLPSLWLGVVLYELLGKVEQVQIEMICMQNGIIFEFLFDLYESSLHLPLTQLFSLKPRIYQFLLQNNKYSPELDYFVEYFDKNQELDEIYIRQEYLTELTGVFRKNIDRYGGNESVLNLYGDWGNGKHFFVRYAAKKNDVNILFVELDKIMDISMAEIEPILKKLILESILTNAVICFTDRENKTCFSEGEDIPLLLIYLMKQIKKRHLFCIWITKEEARYLLNRDYCLISKEMPMLTIKERIVLWKAFGNPYSFESNINLQLCSSQYILTAREIKNVLEMADFERKLEQKEKIGQENILSALKVYTPNQLGGIAEMIPAVYTWEDLIVDETQKSQMEMICNVMKYRYIVGEEWGFYRKNSYGKGICAMFYGAPGTGKTMAAQVIANELQLYLYRVDLSQIVSKYIGETQKNISELFKRAKNMNALLFFDEADSLFAKRTEVRDSRDRGANAETSHLLQKLEDYEGITVLATNYAENIDTAFKRRIKFMIKFILPDKERRVQLWNTLLPSKVPVGERLDFEYYATNFDLSGSSIKEILTNAAYMAASEETQVYNRHIMKAIQLNYYKFGKILTNDDFGYLSEDK